MKNLYKKTFLIFGNVLNISYIKNNTLWFTNSKRLPEARQDNILGYNRTYFRNRKRYVHSLHLFKLRISWILK